MADTRKDVFLLCEPQPGVTRQQLVRNLAATFKKDSALVERMLAHPRFLIKKDADAALATKYETAINKAGGVCELCSRDAEFFLEAAAPVSEPASEPQVPGSEPTQPGSSQPESPKYGSGGPGSKTKRLVVFASFFIFILLLGILAVVFLPFTRGDDATETDFAQIAPESTPAVINASAPALGQRIFSADRRLSIEVPDDWQERKNLSEGASIGAGNSALEIYIIVMAESRDDFDEDFTLANYTDAVLTLLQEIMHGAQLSPELLSYKINGLPAEQVEISGEVDGLGISYLLTTIETDKGFFHVLSWTLSSRYAANRSLMQDVTNSLIIRSFPAF